MGLFIVLKEPRRDYTSLKWMIDWYSLQKVSTLAKLAQKNEIKISSLRNTEIEKDVIKMYDEEEKLRISMEGLF